MSEKFEPKPHTEEELELEKSRAFETVNLIRERGAEFINTPEGPVLSLSERHIKEIAFAKESADRHPIMKYENEGYSNGTKEPIEFSKEEAENIINLLLQEKGNRVRNVRDDVWEPDWITNKKGLVGTYTKVFPGSGEVRYYFRFDKNEPHLVCHYDEIRYGF